MADPTKAEVQEELNSWLEFEANTREEFEIGAEQSITDFIRDTVAESEELKRVNIELQDRASNLETQVKEVSEENARLTEGITSTAGNPNYSVENQPSNRAKPWAVINQNNQIVARYRTEGEANLFVRQTN